MNTLNNYNKTNHYAYTDKQKKTKIIKHSRNTSATSPPSSPRHQLIRTRSRRRKWKQLRTIAHGNEGRLQAEEPPQEARGVGREYYRYPRPAPRGCSEVPVCTRNCVLLVIVACHCWRVGRVSCGWSEGRETRWKRRGIYSSYHVCVWMCEFVCVFSGDKEDFHL